MNTLAITTPTTHHIPQRRLRDLLCSAFEGGSNYWYTITGYVYTDGIGLADFHPGGRFADPNDYWHPAQIVPFQPGCAVLINRDNEDIDGGQCRLDLPALERGIRVMAEKYPVHFADVLQENDDADTGDVFLQCCLFGEVIYG